MRIVVGLGLIVFLLSADLRAGTCFYNVDFNKDRVNEPPVVDSGTNNPTGPVVGNPIVVRSFDQLTNQPLLLSGPNYGQIGFNLARGTPDYTLDFDFETHNLSTSGRLDISLWVADFELIGDGQMWSGDDGSYYSLGWTDDQVHHLHIVVRTDSLTNEPWSVQLDGNAPITNTESVSDTPGDPIAFYLSLEPSDTNVQVAIDNIVIGTTTDFVSVNPLFSLIKTSGVGAQGRMARDYAGNLYGAAQSGAKDNFNGPGSVFKIDKHGNLNWSFFFSGRNGAQPKAGAIIGDDGFLYGTTAYGGLHGDGTVYKMSTDGELIWSASLDGENGSHPSAELIQMRTQHENEIYGTTLDGGAYDKGTVFKLDASRRIQVLHSFTGGSDGGAPLCQLCPDGTGSVYGTTSSGNGTVFKIDSAGRFTTIFSFEGTNGSSPWAGLTKCGNLFYGATAGGGVDGGGTIFSLTSAGVLTTLHSFSQFPDGRYPEAELVLGRDGKLYGTTSAGGVGNAFDGGFGTIFRITTAGGFQKLADFHGGDGSFPLAAMTEGESGKFYGTTPGGYFSAGDIYRLSAMRPVVVIDRPSSAQITEGELEITGKAQCDPPVTNVFYRVNGGGWVPASSTNSWNNWTGTATLAKGRNQIQAYTISAFGDLSRTNTLWIKW